MEMSDNGEVLTQRQRKWIMNEFEVKLADGCVELEDFEGIHLAVLRLCIPKLQQILKEYRQGIFFI